MIWTKFYSYVKKDIFLFVKRKKYLYLSLIIPLLIALIFLLMLSPSPQKIKLGVCNLDGAELSQNVFLEMEHFEPVLLQGSDCRVKVLDLVLDGSFPVGVVIPKGFSQNIENLQQAHLDIYFDNTDIAFANLIDWRIDQSLQPFKKQIIEELNLKLKKRVSNIRSGIEVLKKFEINRISSSVEEIDLELQSIEEMETEFLVNPIWTLKNGVYEKVETRKLSIAFILPIILLFTILMLSSTSLIYDRKNHFISRVKTSTSVAVYVLAKLVFFFILALAQAIIVFLVYLFYGNFYLTNPLNILYLILAISVINTLLGLLIGIISENEGIAILFSLIIALPLMLLSGIFYPLQTVSPFLGAITKILPLHYQINFSKQVLIFGQRISNQWLISASILFLIVCYLVRKKD